MHIIPKTAEVSYYVKWKSLGGRPMQMMNNVGSLPTQPKLRPNGHQFVART